MCSSNFLRILVAPPLFCHGGVFFPCLPCVPWFPVFQQGAIMPKGYLLLVLHAHLPYVRHPEFDRFLDLRWFFAAVTETYIPLIKFFDRLRAEGTPFKVTLSVSPPLANMMEDPLLRERCVRHLDLSIWLAERECERTRHWPDVNFLAYMYR